MGDSHTETLARAASDRLLDRPALSTVVIGATAVGLRNPNSRTNAVEAFLQALTPFNPRKIPVIQLGEVDCGFVIWYRARKHGEPVEAQFAASLAAYAAFVDRLRALGYATVVLTGAALPTIRDGQDWGEIANARREVTATLAERTALTLRYNAGIAAIAAARDLPFVDLTPQTLDPATNTVAEDFRHPDPGNHHLHPARTAALWASQLNALDLPGARKLRISA